MTTTDFLHTERMADDLLTQQLQAKYKEWSTERPRRSNTKLFELFKMCLTEDGKHVLRANEKLRLTFYQQHLKKLIKTSTILPLFL